MLFDGLDMFIYGSVLPHMLAEKALGITPDQAGDLGSYATFGMLVGALAAGTVADRIGRKKLMVACVTLFSLASGLCAMSGSVAVFGLGRTLAGVGLGGLLPTAISMVSDYAPRGRAALTIGMLMTAHHAGGILSAYVALWIVEPLGWRAAFWVCVAPAALRPGARQVHARVAELPGRQGPHRGGPRAGRPLRGPTARRGREEGPRRPLELPGRPVPRRRVDPDPAVLARPPSAGSCSSTASPPGCPP